MEKALSDKKGKHSVNKVTPARGLRIQVLQTVFVNYHG